MTEPAQLDLESIEARTLADYETNSERFWEGTRDHDVSQNVAALLDALGNRAGLRILDLGCGPGRDLVTFRDLGHEAVGLDGCAAFVSMARARAGCEVLHRSFFELDLAGRTFDGIFANASLFHVPREHLPRVLSRLHGALVPGGVLFASNPRSFDADREGWAGERYGTFLTEESWIETMSAIGFSVVGRFLRPAGKPPPEQPWLALVCSKP